ncbi:peptidylprolyl isomerase [Chryseobacterium lactis]|uniref:Peptidylprolyl isomerase n=1 Tax=Chryseobacterium lactis TaxID=1241981 RepID=A0A3G6RG21_CHRLC|nr:peptidylprolyl isomerase [Chryseobacterium lactis]AZA83340.1 peptidylprolyl isomerase [Chryseobacterium lactis]AZB03725.1 peptidylprolyl isomerase [Chryseobacterium lactis]PNW11699.1 peptidylprolyl isomerase [Chryseobacterium lactis]
MKKLFLGLAVIGAHFMFAQKVVGLQVEKPQKKEQQATISTEKVNLYNDNFQAFMAALQSSDRKTIDGLLSDKVKEIVTDDVLKKVKAGIDSNKKLEVLKAGYYKTMDGVNHPSIRYKYAGENSSKEVITAVFEEDGKILGVLPAKKDK